MLAVDTNILVRYLTRDDAAQFARAEVLVEGNEVFVTTTVMLEAEWVLRRGYRCSRTAILEALRSVSGLPRVILEEPTRVAQALGWLEQGMDFADAMHLAGAGGCEAFVTFDRPLIRMAGQLSNIAVRTP